MSEQKLLLNKEKTDILVEKTKTKPQETLLYKKTQPMDNFYFDMPFSI